MRTVVADADSGGTGVREESCLTVWVMSPLCLVNVSLTSQNVPESLRKSQNVPEYQESESRELNSREDFSNPANIRI
jgi:hypothetical protein